MQRVTAVTRGGLARNEAACVRSPGMSYDVLTFAELSDRFSSLRQAPLGDRRAPHKPLLILLMLGRYQRGDFRSLLFEEAQVQLKELLFEFGPSSRSINVLDPFWRLQNDRIWKVEDASGARVRRNGSSTHSEHIGRLHRSRKLYVGHRSDTSET